MLSVSQLKPGAKGKVVRLEGDSSLRLHLLEMGFTKGAEIEFIREAPLGDPVDLRLRGYRLSLRRAEAAMVIIDRIPEPRKAADISGLRSSAITASEPNI